MIQHAVFISKAALDVFNAFHGTDFSSVEVGLIVILSLGVHHIINRPDLSLTCTTPPGLTLIMAQMPRNAESFSSLSRIFLNDVHLQYTVKNNTLF